MRPGAADERRAGTAAGVAAYVLWGLFPLYWGFLEPATPGEVLAARVLFSLAALALLASAVRGWPTVRAALVDRRRRRLLVLAAALVSVNWGVFIWAVAHDLVVDASLGYFINPLVSVALGVVVLGERLRPLQWTAVGVAAGAVLYATLALGSLPWVALALAFSFGLYGLVKKLAGVDAIPSLTIETLVMSPLAVGYLAWLAGSGSLVLGSNGVGHALLMVGAGPVTALPLLLFGYAARRVALSVLGMLQYVAPTLQLLIGVAWLGEPMSTQRWLAFAGVWVALAMLTFDAARASRTRLLRARLA